MATGNLKEAQKRTFWITELAGEAGQWPSSLACYCDETR